HLRVRFHARPGSTAQVLDALHGRCAPALADGRTWKIQLDTYEREVERYGGTEGMELVEEVFHADSEAVLALLAASGRKGLWRLGLAGADALLVDLGFDLAGRRDLAQRLRDGYCAEFRADPSFVHRAGEAFRSERRSLEDIFEEPARPEPLAVRSHRLAPMGGALCRLERSGRLGRSLPEIAMSLVHMHLNRLLRGDLRAQEAVLYDFLFRLYGSLWHRRSGHSAAARSNAGR
ncbi:MAG TPA: thiopeptide-type bacteriocin biosynthesis protein, partial [Thermoanaerobaculia bacterium]